MMSLQNLTWQQVIVILAMLGFAFAAHMYLGVQAGMAMGFLTTLVAFLMGRSNSETGAQ